MDAILVFSSSNPSTSSFNPRPTSGQRAAGTCSPVRTCASRICAPWNLHFSTFALPTFPTSPVLEHSPKKVIAYLIHAEFYPKTLVVLLGSLCWNPAGTRRLRRATQKCVRNTSTSGNVSLHSLGKTPRRSADFARVSSLFIKRERRRHAQQSTLSTVSTHTH